MSRCTLSGRNCQAVPRIIWHLFLPGSVWVAMGRIEATWSCPEPTSWCLNRYGRHRSVQSGIRHAFFPLAIIKEPSELLIAGNRWPEKLVQEFKMAESQPWPISWRAGVTFHKWDYFCPYWKDDIDIILISHNSSSSEYPQIFQLPSLFS